MFSLNIQIYLHGIHMNWEPYPATLRNITWAFQQIHHQWSNRKRTFARQRQLVIWKNMQELLKTGIVERVDYPKWLANLVVVPKNNGEWRIFIDYIEFKKARQRNLSHCHE